MKIKEILLMLLIIAAGIFFYHAQTGKLDWDWDWGGELFFDYDEFLYTESQEFDPPFPPTLDISNAHGEVTIKSSLDNKITVTMVKKIYSRNEKDAREISERLWLVHTEEQEALHLSTNRSDFRRRRFRLEFTVTMPQGMNIRVKNSYGKVHIYQAGDVMVDNTHGEVIVQEASGEIVVKNSYKNVEIYKAGAGCLIESSNSDIKLNNIKGKVSVDSRYGDIHLKEISQEIKVKGSNLKVYAENISGSVEIDSSYKRITLIETGPITIIGNHSPIDINSCRGGLNITNKYDRIEITELTGDMTIQGKNLEIYAAKIDAENINIDTSYENVELTEFTGKTNIILAHGKLTMSPLKLTGPIQAECIYTDIIFNWPQDGPYPLEVKNIKGKILWGLSQPPSEKIDNGETIYRAFLQEKEKPSIFLSSSYRTIWIER
ncbi:MAG: DUF4097 family beta strand repeat protein [Candidatus Aminicenantes bacterium]|nr:DUF4097 family beta strand repeat protein [Candidatus Aminicenantes bacterium]